MEKIQSILQTLSKSEVKYLKHLITVFHGKGDNKLLALIQLIEKKTDITQEEAALKLYQDPKSKAFFMTKGRLMDRLYDLLLLTTDLPNANLVEEDPHASHLADLHKKVPLAIALRKRGLSHIAKNIIEEALKDEMLGYYPNLKIAYLDIYRSMISNDIDELHKVNQELSNLSDILKIELSAIGVLHEIKILIDLKHFNEMGIVNFLNEKLETLKNELLTIYSPRIYLVYLQIQEQLFDSLRKTDDSKKILGEWIELLRKNPLLADNNRKSAPYIKLAHVELHQKNYHYAIKLAKEIAPNIVHRLHNFIVIKSVEIFASFYIGNWEVVTSFDVYTLLLKMQTPNLYYIQYIQFCVLYLQKEYQKSKMDFSVLTPFLYSKEGHNSRLRIFEILIYLETQKIDLAVAKLEALRKHLSKYEAPPRIQATYKILHHLELDSFDFGCKNEEIEAMLIDLEANSPWSAFSLEAVRFDTWVRAQYAKRSYWEQWKVENPHIFG